LSLFHDSEVVKKGCICSLNCEQREEESNHTTRVTEYLEIEDKESKRIKLRYDSRIHMAPRLNPNEISTRLGKIGIDTMPIENITIAIPSRYIYRDIPLYREKRGDGSEVYCFLFKNSGVLPEDDERRIDIRNIHFEEMKNPGFKYCCLELYAMENYRLWNVRKNEGWDDLHNIIIGDKEGMEIINRVMKALDEKRSLGKIGGFKLDTQNRWRFIGEQQVIEETLPILKLRGSKRK